MVLYGGMQVWSDRLETHAKEEVAVPKEG